MADELIHGPRGNILVPADVEVLAANGFLLRRHEDGRVLVEILGPTHDEPLGRVVARLAFCDKDFQAFVTGLVAIAQDGNPSAGTRLSN
jgi:hypothetical protein